MELTASGEAWNEPAFAEETADAGADEDSVFEMEMPAKTGYERGGVVGVAPVDVAGRAADSGCAVGQPPQWARKEAQSDIFAKVDDGPMVVQGMLF